MTCSPSASFFLCFLITFAPLADGTSFDVLKNRTIESINAAIKRITTGVTADQKIDELLLRDATENELRLHAAAQWNYHTNYTKDTAEEAVKSSVRLFLYQKKLITSTKNLSLDICLNHEFILPPGLRDHDLCELDLNDYEKVMMLRDKLKITINELTVCEYRKTNEPCNVSADEILLIMKNSLDPDELKYYWKAWHNSTAFEVKDTYVQYIKTLDHMAQLNNMPNEVSYSMKPYLLKNCDFKYIDRMYEDIKPLYLQLYTHVRKMLRNKFGEFIVSADRPIPVHLLGSVMGQPWTNLLDYMNDENVFCEDRSSNIENTKQLYDQANEFFVSMGFQNVPKSVRSNSFFENNDNFNDCTPMALDMYANNDYRIKMCQTGTADDVYTMHKQLAWIHYFVAYKIQPIMLQHVPNLVFVNGMLDALTLSVQYQDFVDRHDDTRASKHMYLLRMALKKVAVLPFAYAANLWHSTVFGRSFAQKRMNKCWWSKRLKYEGVVSPIARGNDKLANPNYKPFDPSASYDLLIELPHIRHFLSPIIEFQIFKKLCTMCGEYDGKNENSKPLYECNLRGCKDVGRIVKLVMSNGSSKKWPFLFERIVGHRRLDVNPLLEYFKPLYDQLRETNNNTNEYIGWKT